MRKITLLTVLLLCISTVGNAQRERFGVSGGILAGTNLSTFGADDVAYYDDLQINQLGTVRFNDFCKPGFDGGIYINFPIGRVISIEPQVLYSIRTYDSNITNTDLSFVSVPLFLKFNLGDHFALMAGPQFDFLTHVKDDWGFTEDAFKETSTAITAGFETGFRNGIVLYGRYTWGLVDMFEYTGREFQGIMPVTSPTPPQFKQDRDELDSQSIHFGLKVTLFGSRYKKVVETVETETYVEPAPPVEKDTDGDGILDKDDKCPTVAGVYKYQGCPIPDSDNDGINDDEDACPGIAGTAKYKGCPIPDTDGDGINDEEDLCPKTPGVAGNYGCPELVLYYQKNEAKLTQDDKNELDKVVTFLNNHPDVKVTLEGHTSSTGTEDYNMKLSKRRLELSVDYLILKGIDKSRLQIQAYGETRPVADNATAEGRAKNRRVEVKVAK